jgi:fatty acid amide hydrolase
MLTISFIYIKGMGISESVNRIWGRSRNPWDLSRAPGGSSGGDATLVSMGCVPLSVSADGAGSIRIPASCCGVVGFKPSPLRLTHKGCMRPKKDDRFGSSVVIPATIGPMARSVDDCALFMTALCSPTIHKGDRNTVPLAFDVATYEDTKKLTVGYFMTDEWMDPCPTGRRAMQEAIAALKEQGHTVIPFQPPTNGWHHNKL